MPTGGVVLYWSKERDSMRRHEEASLVAVAEALARLKHCEFLSWHRPAHAERGRLYFLPVDTLLRDEAEALGILDSGDLFGGVVPWPFVRTKAITHELIGPAAARPEGWSDAFSAAIRNVVLPGYTAFSADDARTAAARLLEDGAVRVKRPISAGGRGQAVVRSASDLDGFLEETSPEELARYGLVLETELADVTTISVGQIAVEDLTVSYVGTQQLTSDNDGGSVYGGSELTCARGGWPALERVDLPDWARVGIAQARVYDEAMRAYEGFIASRRNYDVGRGVDSRGRSMSGVLEQGWRAGGASPAEVAALEAFAEDPALEIVRVATVEAYGAHQRAPSGATVHFEGVDPACGHVLRYTIVAARGPHAR